jgi:hypothetical protein
LLVLGGAHRGSRPQLTCRVGRDCLTRDSVLLYVPSLRLQDAGRDHTDHSCHYGNGNTTGKKSFHLKLLSVLLNSIGADTLIPIQNGQRTALYRRPFNPCYVLMENDVEWLLPKCERGVILQSQQTVVKTKIGLIMNCF